MIPWLVVEYAVLRRCLSPIRHNYVIWARAEVQIYWSSQHRRCTPGAVNTPHNLTQRNTNINIFSNIKFQGLALCLVLSLWSCLWSCYPQGPGLIFFRKFGNLYQTPGELNTIRPFIVGSAFLYGNTGVVLQNSVHSYLDKILIRIDLQSSKQLK